MERPPSPTRECKRGHYHEPTEEYWYWHKDNRQRSGGRWECRECRQYKYRGMSPLAYAKAYLYQRHYHTLKYLAARKAKLERDIINGTV